MSDIIELNDSELEKVAGGNCVQFDEYSNVRVGFWYTDDVAPGFIFKCLQIDVDLDSGAVSFHYSKYTYNSNDNTARDPFYVTLVTSDYHMFRDASAPTIII